MDQALRLLEEPLLREQYPKINFTETALETMGALREFLRTNKSDEGLRAKVVTDLLDRLQYLNDYGGQDSPWSVRLFQDRGADLSFAVHWMRPNAQGEPEIIFNGGLQFDGVPQPFGSVVLQRSGFWSINT